MFLLPFILQCRVLCTLHLFLEQSWEPGLRDGKLRLPEIQEFDCQVTWLVSSCIGFDLEFVCLQSWLLPCCHAAQRQKEQSMGSGPGCREIVGPPPTSVQVLAVGVLVYQGSGQLEPGRWRAAWGAGESQSLELRAEHVPRFPAYFAGKPALLLQPLLLSTTFLYHS